MNIATVFHMEANVNNRRRQASTEIAPRESSLPVIRRYILANRPICLSFSFPRASESRFVEVNRIAASLKHDCQAQVRHVIAGICDYCQTVTTGFRSDWRDHERFFLNSAPLGKVIMAW